MASEHDTPKGCSIPELIVRYPWTVINIMFWFYLACYIPGLRLPEEQAILSIPTFDYSLVGDWNDKAIGGTFNFYVLWCHGCDIVKHREQFEDRGRVLRVLQKVKKREHDCRDMTWSTFDDPAPHSSPSEYVSAGKSVTLIKLYMGPTDPEGCTHQVGGYLRDIRGQMSGDVKGGLAGPLNVVEGSFMASSDEIKHHQCIMIPLMLLLMWNVCGGWWRSLTNIIVSTWAAQASNSWLLLLMAQWPSLDVGFISSIVPFVCLAFCTDYSIFFWTRFQKEREENPAKEMYGQCIVRSLERAGEVIVVSSIIMVTAYMSTAFYPNMNDMGFMAMNLQLAGALALCGIFSTTVLPGWCACFPSLFENREPNSPNIFQRCLPGMLTTLPEGKQFWKTWTGVVTRGKMMLVIPACAYGCMIPFVICLGKYEPNYDCVGLASFPGTSEYGAFTHLNTHFGAGKSVKWAYVLKATEFGDVDNANLLQVGTTSTSEEVAFAQHAMKMSRKAQGSPFGDALVLQPEFGQAVCKFGQLLEDEMKDNFYQMDETKMETIWYGKDNSGAGHDGCRTPEQVQDTIKKAGTDFEDMYAHYVHRNGEKLLMMFYPGLEITAKRATHLYHLLRDVLEKKSSFEFAMNGKRYWFEAEHTSPISYLKETGVRMKRAAPWIMGFTAGIAFVGVAIMFKSVFLPLKFVMTVIIPISAVVGLEVAVFQEHWFGIAPTTVEESGGINFIIPYIQIGLLFGLAMDYDIFLFARVYEYRQEGYDNVSSVQKSLVETGPVVMTAGTFMCISFFFMMIVGINNMAQMAFMYFFGVLLDSYVTCTCIAPCVLCWGEWLNFFPGYIPPVTKKYNVDEGHDEDPDPQ